MSETRGYTGTRVYQCVYRMVCFTHTSVYRNQHQELFEFRVSRSYRADLDCEEGKQLSRDDFMIAP